MTNGGGGSVAILAQVCEFWAPKAPLYHQRPRRGPPYAQRHADDQRWRRRPVSPRRCWHAARGLWAAELARACGAEDPEADAGLGPRCVQLQPEQLPGLRVPGPGGPDPAEPRGVAALRTRVHAGALAAGGGGDELARDPERLPGCRRWRAPRAGTGPRARCLG